MRHEITPELRAPWKLYDEAQLLLEARDLRRTRSKRGRMRKYRNRRRWKELLAQAERSDVRFCTFSENTRTPT